MKTGFIGLGNLGSAMAKRLINEGVNLILWNRTKSKAEAVWNKVADSPRDVAKEAEIIFLNLFDSDAVKDVLLGENGVLFADCENKVIVDTTTNHPEAVLSFYEEAKKKRAVYLEAPVLGSVVPASQGALTILVSGDKNGYEKVYPYLQRLAQNIFYLETPSLATKMKLINNLLLGVFMAAIGEAVVLAEETGVTKNTALDIFAKGAGNSMVLNEKREKLIKEDFSPHFSCAAIYKDLHYLETLAYNKKTPVTLGSVTKEIFARTFHEKLENHDFSVIYKILKK